MGLRGWRVVVQDGHTAVPCVPSCRVTLACLQFLGCICLYLLRVNISVAIICMTEQTADNTTTHSPLTTHALQPTTHALSTWTSDQYFSVESEREYFAWDRKLQGWILSSFFVGYLLTQVPAGWLSSKLGGKWPIFCGMSLLIVASLVSPAAARYSPYCLIAVQVIKGIACGPFYPSIQYMWGYWAPPLERSKLNAFAMSGSAIGSVLSFSFSGLLCNYGFDGGWPSVFYVYALVSVVWLVAWGAVVFDSPAAHPRISATEQEYIERSLGPFGNSQLKTPPVPWRGMLTSLPFYAILVADFAYQWGWYTAQTNLPKYMENVLKFNISANGLPSSIPYVASWALALLSSSAADALISSHALSVTAARKLFTTLGNN